MSNYVYENRSMRKQRLRDEGRQRDAAWRQLSYAEQLAELDKRPGESRRQRERIMRLMAQEKPRKGK